MSFYLWIDERQEGPFETQQIREMLREHRISDQNLCFPAEPKEGETKWAPLGDVVMLADDSATSQTQAREASDSPNPAPKQVICQDGKTAYDGFKDLLKKYVGQTVGINWDEPKKSKPAQLIGVHSEFFSVLIADQRLTIHYPYHQIIYILEAEGGVSTGFFFTNSFPVVIETMQLVVYSGAVGCSVEM